MVKPERRTKADLLAATAIAAVVAAAAALIWWTSDARATISRPATGPAPARGWPTEVPGLAPSSSGPPRTHRPTRSWSPEPSSPPTVVPCKGAIRSPARCDGPTRATAICAGWPASTASRSRSIATTGVAVRPARSKDPTEAGGLPAAAMPTSGSPCPSDGTTVLSTGNTRLELWRSDMVRMLSYGEIDTRIKPSSKGLHTGCRLTSAAASSVGGVGVRGVRPANRSAAEAAASGQGRGRTRTARRARARHRRGFRRPGAGAGRAPGRLSTCRRRSPGSTSSTPSGTTVGSTLLPKPPSSSSVVTRPGNLITWWTGDRVMVFDSANLTYRYAIGPAGLVCPGGFRRP